MLTFYSTGETCVTTCRLGFYGDTSDRRCKACNSGCRTCADGTSATVCTSCLDDRYLNEKQCVCRCPQLLVGHKRRIRLAGTNSTELEGRLEVLVNGAWSTVCDKNFDFREASVACRQLGLRAAIKAVKETAYGFGRGTVWSNDLNCTGQESTLFQCSSGRKRQEPGCYHSNDVGVVCTGPVLSSPQTNQCLKHCKSGWFQNDVGVCDSCAWQCSECSGASYRCTKCKAPNFLVNYTCVDICPIGKYGHFPSQECRNCNTAECVTCADGSNGNNCTSCRAPKVLEEGKCKLRCRPGLYQKNGMCLKECGISFYKFDRNHSCLPCPPECLQCVFNSTKGVPQCTVCVPPLVFDKAVNACVTNCVGWQFAVPEIIHYPSAPLIRLTNGFNYLEGVLEINHDGVWGTVCNRGWDSRETSVVCRELGLGTADTGALLGHIKKHYSSKIWLDGVFCTGREKSIYECSHRPWGDTKCKHEEYAVLRCSGPGLRTCQEFCPDGFYAKGKACFLCNDSCSTCSGASDKCHTCSNGYYMKNDECVAKCGRGYYLGLHALCRKCDPSCSSCDGKPDNCTSCDPPMYKKGSSCVTDCAPGYEPSAIPRVRLVNGRTPYEGRVEVRTDSVKFTCIFRC